MKRLRIGDQWFLFRLAAKGSLVGVRCHRPGMWGAYCRDCNMVPTNPTPKHGQELFFTTYKGAKLFALEWLKNEKKYRPAQAR